LIISMDDSEGGSASGTGLAAAGVLTVAADGTQTYSTVATPSSEGPVPNPIDLSLGSVYLLLYGTGMRGENLDITAKVLGSDVPVLAYAAQSQYPGLDQVNIGPLPSSLAGRGGGIVQLTVNGVSTNEVLVMVK
jgi:uncharacterized protein (TIGR03437 family)